MNRISQKGIVNVSYHVVYNSNTFSRKCSNHLLEEETDTIVF